MRLVADRSGGWKEALLINLYGTLAALPLIGLVLFAMYSDLRLGPLKLSTAPRVVWPGAISALVALVLHEAFHGLVMRAFGGRPRYGAKIAQRVCPVFYAHCDEPLSRNQYLAVTLAPTVGLTALLLLGMVLLPRWGFYLLTAVMMNVAGSVGDWWIAARARREPLDALIQDHPSEIGYRVVAPRLE